MTHPMDQFGMLRHAIRAELEECMGLLPRRETRQLSTPVDAGVSNSGTTAIDVKADGERRVVATISAPQVVLAGCNGLASVHVFAKDVEIIEQVAVANSMLLLDLEWQSGIGTGKCTVDATRGTFFTVGGTNVINVYARLVSAVEGEPLAAWATKRVELNVHWRTSINPCKAFITTPSVALAAGVPSAFLPIPQQAMSAMAMTDTPSALATLQMDFATEPVAAAIRYSTINPFANGSPIWHGVEWFRFTNSVVMGEVFGGFELYI